MDEGRLGLIDGDAPLGLSGSGVCIRCGAAAVMQLCEALPEALWYRTGKVHVRYPEQPPLTSKQAQRGGAGTHTSVKLL